MVAVKESHSSKKRSIDCPPTPGNTGTPVKKKKKEKENESVSPSFEVSPKHKKKKKRKREEEGEGISPLSDSDELSDGNRKKRPKEEEVSIASPSEQMGKKKKKRNLTHNSEKERSVANDISEPKNERVIEEEEEEEEAVEAKTSKHKDSSIFTAGINTKKKKKKKKKKKDESDVEGSSQEGETPKHRKTKEASTAMPTKLENNDVDVTVSLETSISSSTKKKDGMGVKSQRKKSGQSRSSYESLSSGELDSSLISELEEFVPDVRKKSAHEIMKLIRYDLHRFKDFKQQGVPLRCGRFTVSENDQIQKNLADFAALTGIGSAEQVLFPQRFKEQAAEIRRLKIQHGFLEKIAEGVPRPCHQVYTRAKKIFDERNHMGRFSVDELKSLRKLHKLHGNDWKTMAGEMDRSVYALQKRFVCLGSVHGPWHKEEESRLKQAVQDHLETVYKESLSSGLSMDQLCSNLPWMTISQKVETRHWNQCRFKWFSLLKKRTNSGFHRGPKGYQTKILLINTLFSMSVDDQADIEWDEVANAVGGVTPMFVQRMFHRLKVSQVPNWNRMSYGDIIVFLHHHVVPALKKRLSSCKTIPDSQEPQAEVTYQLSDILSVDEDFEVDNS